MVRVGGKILTTVGGLLLGIVLTGQVCAEDVDRAPESLLHELESTNPTVLEDLVHKGSGIKSRHGYASYYAARFIGRRTTSGRPYDPDKMTAAHHSLPLGTVVRVVNLTTNQDVHVVVNDRCSRKPYPFIDLSRAAAKKIGLWGKGRIKAAIIPLLEDPLEDPA